jgi:5-methylcytosine-specific restriction enzyme subunit McrC
MKQSIVESRLKVIELDEYEEKLLPKVSKEVAAAINETGFITVEPTFGEESIFRADSKIGIVRVGDIQIKVMPKFPVNNLFYLLGLHDGIKFESDAVNIEESRDITDLIFESFLRNVLASTARGLLTGYRRVEETSKVLHGRVLIGEQLKKRQGHMYPVEVAFDEFTDNIPENIELNLAISKAMKFGNLTPMQHRDFRHLSRRFSEIDRSKSNLHWTKNRHNSHYWNSLVLADLINSGKGFYEELGGVAVSGFTVDMYRVFEKFLLRELKVRLERQGGVVESNYLHLDEENRQRAQVDIMWRRDGQIKLIADAKYKDPATNWESALYQVNTYATAFSLDSIHLIYALPVDEAPLRLKGNGPLVYRHGIDLSLDISAIRMEIDQLSATFLEKIY